jgi:AcrR family transcriptional regulator
MSAPAVKIGLRERKKLRTRQAIVEVSTRLFLEQGYQQTTLAQIADEVEVALSTFFNYFASKVDIVFCLFDAVIESAEQRLADRPDGEPAADAIVAWLSEELPRLEQPYADTIRRLPKIVASSPELQTEERLRYALLEDVLAAGFARDLGDSPNGMRPRILAVLAWHGMVEAWEAWYEKHATDPELDLEDALRVKADYVQRVLANGLEWVGSLPDPPRSARA